MMGNFRFSTGSRSLALLFSAFLQASLLFSRPVFSQETPWVEVEARRFGFFESLQRTQGLATDQQGNVWYSANQNMIRVKGFTGSTKATNSDPIPEELKRLGENHVGDIDVVSGFVFAPIEDGPKYQRPFVGIYTGSDLELVKLLELSPEWLPDGIPWITADLEHQTLITAQYNKTTRINLYDMRTGAALRQIPMSDMLDLIQGGKYFNNHLYMTANDPMGGHAIFDMDLMSGKVQKIIHLNDEIVEVEGLAYLANSQVSADNPSISDFFVLGVAGSGLKKRMVLYHWKR
ncbi:MAG: hypothetical protein ACJ763_06420 [Bdellovibrionia bacterium]